MALKKSIVMRAQITAASCQHDEVQIFRLTFLDSFLPFESSSVLVQGAVNQDIQPQIFNVVSKVCIATNDSESRQVRGDRLELQVALAPKIANACCFAPQRLSYLSVKIGSLPEINSASSRIEKRINSGFMANLRYFGQSFRHVPSFDERHKCRRLTKYMTCGQFEPFPRDRFGTRKIGAQIGRTDVGQSAKSTSPTRPIDQFRQEFDSSCGSGHRESPVVHATDNGQTYECTSPWARLRALMQQNKWGNKPTF